MRVSFLGNEPSAVARGMAVGANYVQSQSSMASTRTGFLLAMQDRLQQANMAGYEIKSIDKQILTQLIRIDMATRDISNQQQIIDNSNEVMDFLTTKYTNTDLYEHLESQERTLSYQLYTLAYGLVKRAEKASILKGHWKSTRLSSTLAIGTRTRRAHVCRLAVFGTRKSRGCLSGESWI